MAYYARATIYLLQEKYVAAEKDYQKAIKLLGHLGPCSLLLNGLGCSKYKLGEYRDAIDCFDMAIKTDSNYVAAYNNRGNAYYKLKQYKKASYNYRAVLKCEPSKQKTCNWEQFMHSLLPDFVLDIETYIQALHIDNQRRHNILNDIIRLMKFGKENYDDILKVIILENEDFNIMTHSDTEHRNNYSIIYSHMLHILSLLYIDNIHSYVSHYTSKSVIYSLIFESSPLRFSNIRNTNDIQEGSLLYSLLNITQDDILLCNAYIACFVLDPDNHNMFRLYGKTKNTENSGFSLSLNPSFFSNQLSFSSIYQSDTYKKSPLFSCVYVNNIKNKDNQIIITSIGGNRSSNISEVQAHIDIIQQILVDNKDLSTKIIANLLLPLPYLFKSDSWKEENECRIIKVVQNTRNIPIDYINYIPIIEYITDIFLV